jgi:hypothetical protein
VLKDAFRAHALRDIGSLLSQLYELSSLRELVLQVLASYIEWIPIEDSMTFLEKVMTCAVSSTGDS